MSGTPQSLDPPSRADRQLRVLLAIPSFRGGGAEKVICSLAGQLPRDRFDVHLTVVQNEGPLAQSLPEHVVRHTLNCTRVSRAAVPFLRLVRRLVPDVVLTAASHLNALAGMLHPAFPRRTRLIIRETGVLETSLAGWRTGRLLKPVIALAYRQADCVIGQSTFAIHEIARQFRVEPARLVRISNPIDVERWNPEIRLSTANPFGGWGPGPHLLGVGRLGPEKGFDRLLQAFPQLRCTHPHAQLWILGDGNERSLLSAMSRDLGIDSCVHLPGFQPDISRWMAHADLFVLSSRSESLPNVLLEAVACDCPIVALEQIGGTRELLEQLGLQNRWLNSLVPWQDQWFQRSDPAVRERLVSQFQAERIVGRYGELFEEVSAGERSEMAQRRAA